MLFEDTYITIAQPGESNFREKASKFIGYAFPVQSESEVKEFLNILRNKYPDATHHCYAYILGYSKDIYRAVDDGEPSNSAGKPILRAIQSAGLTNVLVVVVRYFGGTLLGIPGLIYAYGESAKLTLEHAGKTEKIVEEIYTIKTIYSNENDVFKILKFHQATIIQIQKNEQVEIIFRVRKSSAEMIYGKLQKLTNISILFQERI